jgi:hypothetical protein
MNGSRNNDYGDPVENFEKIAMIANLIGETTNVSAIDCVNVLIALKLSRESYKHKEDNLIDLAAYVDIKQQIYDAIPKN